MGFMMVFGPCYGCGTMFGFNADHVPSVRVDGVREPVCQACVTRVNPVRAKNGLPPIHVHPDAYEPSEGY